MTAYETLAPVYDWLVPEALLEPEGNVAAFAGPLGGLPPGARVLDCAAGPGRLAVGLALAGFAVTATDASPGMIALTCALARERGVAIHAETCAWRELAGRGWEGAFAAVLCVGNSLVHAAGRAERRVALRAMGAVLADGGVLVVTSRDWEAVRRQGSRAEAPEEVVRGGRAGAVRREWTIPPRWDAAHTLTITVSTGGAEHREALAFWPFTAGELREDLAAAGLTVATWSDPSLGRYLVTARRRARPAPPAG